MLDKETHNRIEDKIISIHPKFLDLLRDLHPLAFLSSFSLLIATFIAKNEYEVGQEYAIIASLCFLIAFIASFVAKIVKDLILIIPSIAATVLGFIFLFLIIVEFIKNISLANRLLPALFMIFYSLILVLYYNYAVKDIWNAINNCENLKKAIFLFSTILSLFFGVLLLTLWVFVLSYHLFMGKNTNYQLLYIIIITSLISYEYYMIYKKNDIKFSNKITSIFQDALIICAGFTLVSWCFLISIYSDYFMLANLILAFVILSFSILGSFYQYRSKNNNV